MSTDTDTSFDAWCTDWGDRLRCVSNFLSLVGLLAVFAVGTLGCCLCGAACCLRMNRIGQQNKRKTEWAGHVVTYHQHHRQQQQAVERETVAPPPSPTPPQSVPV
mmetsp:Transcript_47667/g.94074  ORF Transcript_47667/g.94074 Transcript_47667/m.94074 type:complete len:105 (+) Transcript_47667:474-788(+)